MQLSSDSEISTERWSPAPASVASPAVHVDNVTLRRKGRAIISGLSLTVPHGSVFLLVGRNGAGKSTLMRALMGLNPIHEGTVSVCGRPLTDVAAIRACTGYVPDSGMHVPHWMRIRDVFWVHSGYYRTWDPDYAAMLCQALEVDTTAHYGNCSKGEARRVQLLLALAHRPKLLILDEALDGLDAAMRTRVIHILADYVSSWPATILLSSHYFAEVGGLADHIGVMVRGRLTIQSAIAEVQRKVTAYSFIHPDPASVRLEHPVIERRQSDGEARWIISGDESNIRLNLARAGARAVSNSALSFDELVRALATTSQDGIA